MKFQDLPTNDDRVLAMLSGANFGPNANLTLPSGTTLDADEANAFTNLFGADKTTGGDAR